VSVAEVEAHASQSDVTWRVPEYLRNQCACIKNLHEIVEVLESVGRLSVAEVPKTFGQELCVEIVGVESCPIANGRHSAIPTQRVEYVFFEFNEVIRTHTSFRGIRKVFHGRRLDFFDFGCDLETRRCNFL